MFRHIYIEQDAINTEYAKRVLSFFPQTKHTLIQDIAEHFGVVRKPYLHKRTDLNLFIGKKKGTLIKEAPDAYGIGTGKHYYFIHAYNCIYECEYCFLQGYFNSPDIVLFINHNEIIEEMKKLTAKKNEEIWFHAGEFSDSLALSHITKEWEEYWRFFKDNPRAKLELRSKSTNIKAIENLEPLSNIIITFSLSDTESSKTFDRKTPPTKARIKAIEKLVQRGFQIGIHFDPIVYKENIFEDYQELINTLKKVLPDEQTAYFSLGVVRYTKDVYHHVEKNYPNSSLVKQPYQKSFDGKVRYSRPLRGKILKTIQKQLVDAQYSKSKIYLCMEDDL